jgi:sugar phosphate isomerase/epimerase
MMKSVVVSLLALVCSVIAAGDAGIGKSFEGPLGLQLYSLRADFMAHGVPATLDKVKAFGFTNVELAGTYNLPADKFKAMLDERGLKPVSGHFGYDRYKKEPEKVAAEAKALGLQYAGCAWISHKAPFNEAACRDAIETFNKAGEALKKEGIQFFYHCHGYEFHPHGDGTLWDLLVKETKPEFVSYQMDVLWVVFPGQDPVKLLEKYPGRWVSMHLKDLRKGIALGSLSGGTDVKNDVVLGTGQTDWPAVLKAAKKAGVKYYFIEDESPDVKEQIPQHLKFLEGVEF